MKKYLSLYAFDISQMELPKYPLYQMDFPIEWKSFLSEFNEGYLSKVKLSNLRIKLQSFFPQILAGYDDHLTSREAKPWLLAVEEISAAWIKRLTLNWLKELFKKDKKLLEHLESIPGPELSWRPYEILDRKDPIRFQLFPGLYAHDLCREQRTMQVLDHQLTLKFNHVFYGRDHECMSEPGTEEDRAFSYVLRFSLINRGGQTDKDLLRVHVGTRRYYTHVGPLSKEAKVLKSGAKATFLLNISNPYVHNDGTPQTFSALKFKKNKWGSDSYARWVMPIEDLYSDILHTPIRVDEFLTDPVKWMRGDGRIRGFFVYNNKAFEHEPFVQAGLGLPERSALIEMVKSVWDIERYQLTQIPELNLKVKGLSQRLPVQTQNMKNTAIEFWMKEEMFKSCMEILQTPMQQLEDQPLLYSTERENTFLLNSSQEVVLQIVCIDNSLLVQDLDEAGREGKRIKEIQNSLPPGKKTSALAFVEIGNKLKYQRDPKQAVRLGLAKTGRLSQFIYDLGKDTPEGKKSGKDQGRVINSFLDLLSDAGYYRANVRKIVPGEQLIAVGILHRYSKRLGNEYLPVLIWFNGHEILAKRRGDTQWLTLKEALLNYNGIQAFQNRINAVDGRLFVNWLEQELETILLKHHKTTIYLFADAGLRLSWWGELGNARIQPKELPLKRRLFHDERLKVIRINHTNDVPQYDIMNIAQQSTINRSKGLFRDGAVYYSVGSRPDTIQTNKMMTKIDYPGKLLLKQQAVEFFPTGVSSAEEADELAKVAHLLRNANLTFGFSTAQPFPLHLLKSFQKYWAADLLSEKRDDDGWVNEFQGEGFDSGMDERLRLRIRRKSGYGKFKIR